MRVASWAFLENRAVDVERKEVVVEKASVVGRRVASAMIVKRAMLKYDVYLRMLRDEISVLKSERK